MQNVTFHKEKETWRDAANICSNDDGVLESNLTLLLEQFTHLGERKDIWLGKSKLVTDWTYIRGMCI